MASTPVTPPRFVDPPAPPVPQQTISRWDQFIGSIATGVTVPDAMLKHYIKRADIETMTRKNSLELKRYQEAKIAGLRSAYSMFDLDEFFNAVAMGLTVGDAFQQVWGHPPAATFYEILRNDPDMEDRYQNALKTKAVVETERMLEIVDDDTNDLIDGGVKGMVPNMAAVQRSKLRAETRHKLAGNWYRRIYGEKDPSVKVEINVNHAERLEEARTRARTQRAAPRISQQDPIDAQFTEVAPVEEPARPMDLTWMDGEVK